MTNLSDLAIEPGSMVEELKALCEKLPEAVVERLLENQGVPAIRLEGRHYRDACRFQELMRQGF